MPNQFVRRRDGTTQVERVTNPRQAQPHRSRARSPPVGSYTFAEEADYTRPRLPPIRGNVQRSDLTEAGDVQIHERAPYMSSRRPHDPMSNLHLPSTSSRSNTSSYFQPLSSQGSNSAGPRIIVAEPNHSGGSNFQPRSSQGSNSAGPRIIVAEPNHNGGSTFQPLSSQGSNSVSPRIIVREPNDRGGSYSQPLSSQGPGSVGPRIIVREPHDTGGPSARVDPQLPPNGIGIGIETEFLLAPQSDKLKASTTDGFVTKLAKLYNGEVKSRHPRMSTQRGVATVNGVYGQVWALVFDGSIIKNKASDIGLELISPILKSYPGKSGSDWILHVEEIWWVLKEYYHVTGNASCGTHVHISIAGGYTKDIVIRVAQAAIHFEKAFEQILPKDRRGNPYSKSNYIHNTNLRDLSRTQAINKLRGCRSMKEVVEKFCPDRYYGWNYLNLIGPKGTIEFRRGPVSTRKKTVLFWTHAVRLFIKAAIYNYPDFRALLQQYPEDIGGLRKYLSSTESLPTIVASHLDTFNDNEKREPTLELSMPRV